MKKSGYLFTEDIEGNKTFTFYLNVSDLVKFNPDKFDRFLLSECEKSPKTSDKLLALETIYRKVEEVNAMLLGVGNEHNSHSN